MTRIYEMDGSFKDRPDSGLVRRAPPGIKTGPYLPGILLEAAESFKMSPYSGGIDISRMQFLLNPPQITKASAPFCDRLKVFWRMLMEIDHETRHDGWLTIDGGLDDDCWPYLRPAPQSSRYIHIVDKSGGGLELHLDTVHADTTLVFWHDYSTESLGRLKKRLSKDTHDLQGNGVDILISHYRGWKLPILGIKRVLTSDGSGDAVLYDEDGAHDYIFPEYTNLASVGRHPLLRINPDGSLRLKPAEIKTFPT